MTAASTVGARALSGGFIKVVEHVPGVALSKEHDDVRVDLSITTRTVLEIFVDPSRDLEVEDRFATMGRKRRRRRRDLAGLLDSAVGIEAVRRAVLVVVDEIRAVCLRGNPLQGS